jgi:hypothetical protein
MLVRAGKKVIVRSLPIAGCGWETLVCGPAPEDFEIHLPVREAGSCRN